MKSKWFFYIEDDSVLAPSTADILLSFCNSHNIGFRLLMSVPAVQGALSMIPRSSLQFAIVDLWMNDQQKGTSDRTAGFRIFQLVRGHSPNSYIILLSGHIDTAVEEKFKNERNIAIVHKPMPDEELKEFLEYKIKEIIKE